MEGEISYKTWALEVTRKVEHDFPRDDQQVSYAIGRTKDEVLVYIESTMDHKGKSEFDTLEELLEGIDSAFGNPDPYSTAARKLNKLYQGNMEFGKFFTQYKTLVNELQYGSQAQVFNLIERISPRLRRTWDQQIPQPREIKGARETLLVLDRNMRASDERYPREQKASSAIIPTSSSRVKRPTTVTISKDLGKIDPQSFIRQGIPAPTEKKRLTPEEITYHKSHNLCFKCHKSGHDSKAPHDEKGRYIGSARVQAIDLDEENDDSGTNGQDSNEEYNNKFDYKSHSEN